MTQRALNFTDNWLISFGEAQTSNSFVNFTFNFDNTNGEEKKSSRPQWAADF